MTAVRIVPTFDELEHRQAGFRRGLKGAAVQQFTFQGGEETLTQGVVKAVADGAPGRPDPDLPAAVAERQGSVLAAVI